MRHRSDYSEPFEKQPPLEHTDQDKSDRETKYDNEIPCGHIRERRDATLHVKKGEERDDDKSP
jgi:hypothetical protein